MWRELAEYARLSPSPHNTQPARLCVIDDTRASLGFVPERGLRVGDPLGRFTYVTFGIFVESMRIAAHAQGRELIASYVEQPLYGGEQAFAHVAELELRPARGPIEDLQPELLARRRTNRHPYDPRPVPPAVLARLQEEARRYGHRFDVATDRRAIGWVKQVNLDALAHDLSRPDYRGELDAWLRYSDAEARERRDGLSPAAMALPGWLMRGMVRHHWLFSAPVVRAVVHRIYLSTMRGISTVGWIQGDFARPADWVRAGELMLRLWLILTEHGIDWQPYGSVITDDAARRSLVDRFGLTEDDAGHDQVWLLVRLGYCDREPARSVRLPLEEVMR